MKYVIGVLLSLSLIGCPSEKEEHQIPSKNYQIAFYNVENLFDTINAPGKRDGEYTPDGSREWNTTKYQTKLDRIAQVIASIDSTQQIAAIGLAEVENRQVLEDLVRHELLKKLNFEIIHQESPDFRGIDVALLYNPKLLTSINSQFLPVNLNDSGKTTRDILRADFIDGSNDSIIVYINHWPSRWGGTEKSQPKRIAAANCLRANLEPSTIQQRKILILGDLNDYPNNKSVWSVLGADTSLENNGGFYNPTYYIHIDSTQGTHAYRGEWGVLDHAIFSPLLWNNVESVYVHKRKFMLYETRNGDWFPSRTHSGKKYYAGYSDHLPIVVQFK